MFTTINGYTKEKMKEVIRANFKGKASDNGGGCYYLTEDGRRCAVGCFIDEATLNNIDTPDLSMPVAELLENYEEVQEIMPLGLDGLKVFQSAHDTMFGSTDPEVQKEILINWIDNNVKDANATAN